MRVCAEASRLVPANNAWSCASSGARTDACQRPVLSVVTRGSSIQWSPPTSRPRSWICCPGTPAPLRVSRPEMSKDCQAVAVAGAWMDIRVPVGFVVGGFGAEGGEGAGEGGAVGAVPPMFASARSCAAVPWNVFMSVCARMPAIRLVLEYCQNVHVVHAPPKVVGLLP